MILVIGNKNYSSWSLRAWLALKLAGLPFEEVLVPLDQPDSRQRLREHSPTGRVPVLKDGSMVVPESLAIIEYAAELRPDAHLWPQDQAVRAVARAVAAEMHAGFAALRHHMPMNVRRRAPGKGDGPGVADDIARIAEVFRTCRTRFGTGGDFLFGAPGAADAMFAPVASRFRTYDVALDPVAQAYVDAVLSLPAMQAWARAALAEPWTIPAEEVA